MTDPAMISSVYIALAMRDNRWSPAISTVSACGSTDKHHSRRAPVTRSRRARVAAHFWGLLDQVGRANSTRPSRAGAGRAGARRIRS